MRKKGSNSWYEINHDVKIYFDITNPLTWQLIQGKDIEKNVKDVFLNNISEGYTVIDVGAHIGEYSLIASKNLGNTGQIISIEPLKEARKWLKRNIELNDCQNSVVLECAIGKESGKKLLYRNSLGGVFGYLDSVIDHTKLMETGIVNVTTIDQILSSRRIDKVDMLKIDIEGFGINFLILDSSSSEASCDPTDCSAEGFLNFNRFSILPIGKLGINFIYLNFLQISIKSSLFNT